MAGATIIYRLVKSEGVERQQMKWLVLSVSVLVVGITLDQLIFGLIRADGWRAVWTGLLIMQTLLIMAVAIIRYRIYDIDRIVSRTVSYGLIVGLLAALFLGVVTTVTGLLPSQNSLAIAASTLVAAALFYPLRTRIQRSVDRRFNRGRYESQQVIDDFASGLQDETDLEDLADDLGVVVAKVLEPSSVGIWIKG